jgi:glycerate kinase
MRILVALDKFKGSLSAWEACQAVRRGILEVCPDADVITRPMADGGEGTARELMSACHGSWIALDSITGPLPRMKVEGGFVWFDDEKTALVEMASVNGLTLLHASNRNPLETTTFGTGQLLKAAARHGAEKILLSVGGSATVDGGVGAAMALGWRFLGADGHSVPLGGKGLRLIHDIDGAEARDLPPIEVLCDVDNPLLGENGAARMFAPQKGATPAMVDELEQGLANLAQQISLRLRRSVHNLAGAGAAGGLAAGARAFFDADLVSGVETFIERTGLASLPPVCDYVLTGEGCFDDQSLHGKVVAGVAGLAAPAGVPVGVLAGKVQVEPFRYRQFGIVDALASKPAGLSLTEAMRDADRLLAAAASAFAQKHFLQPEASS